METFAEQLGELEVYQRVRVTVGDHAVTGMANPIDYVPEDRLYIEVSPDEEDARYAFEANYSDGEWAPVEARRVDVGDNEENWEALGEVTAVEPQS